MSQNRKLRKVVNKASALIGESLSPAAKGGEIQKQLFKRFPNPLTIIDESSGPPEIADECESQDQNAMGAATVARAPKSAATARVPSKQTLLTSASLNQSKFSYNIKFSKGIAAYFSYTNPLINGFS